MPRDSNNLTKRKREAPPSCWYCSSRAVGPGATLILTSLPFRRNGALDAPRAGRPVQVFYACYACAAGPRAARDARAYTVPLVVLYAGVEYDEWAARLAAEPWWTSEVAAALARARAVARVEETDDGPEIEAAVASATRETPRGLGKEGLDGMGRTK